MSAEPIQTIPVWVMFPKLPVQYWAIENLSRIASCIGIPICTDKLTAQGDRISYARILIDMDVSQPLPESVVIEDPSGEYLDQKLEYEWRPN